MNFLKVLFNPIFLLAVGLHAGLLMIPVAGGSSEDLVPAPDPEGESITVTRIPPKRNKPASGAGQTPPKANRPATVGQAASVRKTAARSNQPSSQSAQSRSRGGQRSSRNSASGSSGDSPSTPSQNTPASPADGPGLPDLLDEAPNRVAVTVPSDALANQAAPTLIALREGADTRSVPQRLQDFLARLQYSLQGTRDVAAAQAAWLGKLEEQPAVLSSPQELEIPLEISYPVTIAEEEGPRQIYTCLSPLPKQGLIGAVVDANGAIAGEPTLLRSSGYPFLNDVALKKIQDYADFPTENTQKIYTVPFDVKYDEDACLSLADISRTASTASED